MTVPVHFALSGHLGQGQIDQMLQHFVQPTNMADFQNVMVYEPIFFFFQFLPEVRDITVEKLQMKSLKGIYQNLRKTKNRKQFRQMSMLKRIEHIGFETLQYLAIPQNTIDSIEPLTYMKLPAVVSVDLRYNKIAYLKPIQKLHLDCLRKLDLIENPIGRDEIRLVGRMYEGGGEMRLQCVEIWYGYNDKIKRQMFRAKLEKDTCGKKRSE